jgi:chitinase
VSYDDVESVRRKAEYVKAEGLAGASLSTLDLDDFNNLCCQVRGHYMFSALQESIVRLGIRVKMASACEPPPPPPTTTKAGGTHSPGGEGDGGVNILEDERHGIALLQ